MRPMAGFGLVVLRLVLAAVFAAHGAHILFGALAAPGIGVGGLQATAAQYGALGLHPELLLAILAGLVQLLGGVMLACGWLTRWAAAALIIYLGIGIWKEHYRWGFFLNWLGAAGRGQGVEYSVVLIGALVCLIIAGAGDWSLDGYQTNSAAKRAAGRARLRGKI
jgi:putative oxidoreductase